LLAPDDPRLAEALGAECFVLSLGDEGEEEVSVVRRAVVDVCEDGDGGWLSRRGSGRSGKGRRVSSR
jgi:hypothetical protein